MTGGTVKSSQAVKTVVKEIHVTSGTLGRDSPMYAVLSRAKLGR
jgi:hypothetical protein